MQLWWKVQKCKNGGRTVCGQMDICGPTAARVVQQLRSARCYLLFPSHSLSATYLSSSLLRLISSSGQRSSACLSGTQCRTHVGIRVVSVHCISIYFLVVRDSNKFFFFFLFFIAMSITKVIFFLLMYSPSGRKGHLQVTQVRIKGTFFCPILLIPLNLICLKRFG